MALCKFCQHYTDKFEWPEEYREFSRPNLCFECYKQDPSRGVLFPGLEDNLPQPKEEMQTSSEERESETTTEEEDPDGSEDIFPDEDDGCQTEDDDYEDDPDDH